MRWPKATLGECATLVNGRAYKQEELLDSGTPVLRIQNLNGGDRWYYSDLSLPQDKYCDKGDLLFAWSASFGPYLWNSPRAIYHYHIWKVLPGKSLDKGFLYHLLGFLTARVKSESHGASMLHMTKARMEALEIPLPPLEEQRRIAAILDMADSLEKLSQSAVARLHQTLASSFRRLSSVTAPDCTSRKLEEVVEAIIDYRGKSPEKTAKGVPLITARLIKEGRILEATEFIAPESYSEWMRRGMPKRGDVVFTTEAPLGQVAQIDNPDVALAQRLVLLRGIPHDLDNTYLRFALRMSSVAEQIRKRATGSTVLGIRQKELRQIQIPLPPLTAQKDFARLALAIEEKIRQMRQRGDITMALRHSLASRLMEE